MADVAEAASQTILPETGSFGALLPLEGSKLDAVNVRVTGTAAAGPAQPASSAPETSRDFNSDAPVIRRRWRGEIDTKRMTDFLGVQALSGDGSNGLQAR